MKTNNEINKDEIDFYGMGMRKVDASCDDIDEIADTIEELYGIDARLQFECGVSVSIEESYIEKLSYVFEQDIIHTVDNSGLNLRNNSYFGGCGVSKKYKEDGSYNEPKTAKYTKHWIGAFNNYNKLKII